MKRVFLGWFVGLIMPVQEIFYPAFAALASPVQNIFLLTAHFFTIASPLPRNLGRPSCRVACLLICVSGRKKERYIAVESNTYA
jgi:hypothetical protein